MLIDRLITGLQTSYVDGTSSFDTMDRAFRGLRGRHTIRRYFEAYHDLVRADLALAVNRREDNIAVKRVLRGHSSKEVAESLTIDRFRYFLSKYGGRKRQGLHNAWARALPEVYPNGRLPNILGF